MSDSTVDFVLLSRQNSPNLMKSLIDHTLYWSPMLYTE